MADPSTHTYNPTYHKTDAPYALPNDSTEHARLEDQAAGLAELMHNTIIHAPLTKPTRILDLGCGTGTVTRHLGALFPAAHVSGIDISPVPPVPTPPNVDFITADFRSLSSRDPRFPPASVDFIFSRLLVCGVTDWPAYVRDVAALLRPGAWTEMQDATYEWYRDGKVCTADWAWLRAMREVAPRRGWDIECGRNIAGYMKDAGLVDVTVREFRVPYGTWAVGERPETKRIGEHSARENPGLYHFMIERMLEGEGYGREEIRAFQRESGRCHAAEVGKEWVFYITMGRKPESVD